MKEIDARGLACPAPVLQTKNAIEEEKLSSIEILVDNEAARQNVSRFLKSQDFEVSVQEREGDFAPALGEVPAEPQRGAGLVIGPVVSTDIPGTGIARFRSGYPGYH